MLLKVVLTNNKIVMKLFKPSARKVMHAENKYIDNFIIVGFEYLIF